MKILLYHPWHRFQIYYIAKLLSNHDFYYLGGDGNIGTYSGSNINDLPTPTLPNFYTIKESEKSQIKLDLQLVIHGTIMKEWGKILDDSKRNDLSIVYYDYFGDIISGIGNYPVIYAIWSHKKSSFVKNWVVSTAPRDPDIWNAWTGINPVAVNSGFWERDKLPWNETIRKIQKAVPSITNPSKAGPPFQHERTFLEYRELMRTSRAYWESSARPLSGSIIEAMTLGMPVLVYKWTDYSMSQQNFSILVRNGIDGYCSNDSDFLIDKLNEFIGDLDLAKKWGLKARTRIMNLSSPQKQRRSWEWAINKAFEVHNKEKGKNKI